MDNDNPSNPGRRSILKAGALAGAAFLTASCTAAPGKFAENLHGRIIDFRIRPPFRGFRAALHAGRSPASSDDELMAQLLAEMAEAGIGHAVAMGRVAPAAGAMAARIPNADVIELVRRYPKLFSGFGSVDVRDQARALDDIDRCLDSGLRGIAFDNPLSVPPLYDDDARLFPLYERCARHGLIISLTSSVMVGPDMTYSMPLHIQRVGLAFPQTPIVVPHAAWPWTLQMIAAVSQGQMFKLSNIYMMPDFYFSQAHAPGRHDYIDAADYGLDNRILFASSYPALPLVSSVAAVRSIAFARSGALRRIMHDNAAALLN